MQVIKRIRNRLLPDKSSALLREAIWAYIFILPNIVLFLLFVLVPVVTSLVLSFMKWDILSPPQYAGLKNYQILFFQDRVFWKTLVNTFYYIGISVPAGIVLSLFLAVALNQKLRGIIWYRAIYFFPVITSSVAVAIIWMWLYNTDIGLINLILAKLRLSPIPWLTSTTWAMPALIIMGIWQQLGFNMILFLASLQEVPTVLYDSAEIDGGRWWVKFRYITLPLITPTVFFVLVINFILSFQTFDQIYIMTQGGPARATSLLVYYLYQNAFEFFKMGRGSAIAY
ncbi:MAG: ABC transporter permease subunit, partial [Firmicutes bacterium]|nr:ABC transporter permease subunit [Bacillota bacterium]